jgi:hypothetical protein
MTAMHNSARRVVFAATAAAAALLTACSDSTAPAESSTFSADVRGTTNERITGTATASVGGDWLAQSALQVTLPNGVMFSGVALAASNGTTISFFRPGSELPSGTFALGTLNSKNPSGLSAGYVVRRSDGFQLFVADSGTASFAQAGNHVSGTFTLYAKHYDVIPFPTSGTTGKPITPIASGDSPVTVSGSFAALRR